MSVGFRALINREGMAEAFGVVAGVASHKSPKPILQNVLLSVSESGASLAATDMEVGIRRDVLGVKAEGVGDVVLPTARFGAILRSCGDAELEIESDGDKLTVKGLRASFTLPAEDASLFPAVPGFDATGWIVVSSADLRKIIRRTAFCTNAAETRYAMGGVLFELRGNGSLRGVATDGRRLAFMDVESTVEGDLGEIGQPVLPVKALKLIEKSIADDGPPVHLAFTSRSVFVRTENAVISSRLIEGKYPKYEDAIPAAKPIRVPLNVGEFRSAVEQASIVTTEESRAVDFRFGDNGLVLSSQSADAGSSIVELPIVHHGLAIDILVSPVFLGDALKTLDEESEAFVELVDQRHVFGLTTADGYGYYVSPMSREK